MSTPSIIVIAVLALVLLVVWNKLQMARRADYIRSFALPRGLYDRLRKKRPELTLRDCQLVSRALRQFFLTHLKSGRQFVLIAAGGHGAMLSGESDEIVAFALPRR